MTALKQKSTSVSETCAPLDPRAARTLERIDAAFVALLHRRAYSGIRISDIAKKAGVGRATFYAHYRSKQDLLRSQMRRIVMPMLLEAPGDPCLLDCTPLFLHVREVRQIYRALMSGASRIITERILQDSFEARVAELLARTAPHPRPDTPIPSSVVARFAAASLAALIAWWVENETRSSPEQMQAAYRSLVGGGLNAATSA